MSLNLLFLCTRSIKAFPFPNDPIGRNDGHSGQATQTTFTACSISPQARLAWELGRVLWFEVKPLHGFVSQLGPVPSGAFCWDAGGSGGTVPRRVFGLINRNHASSAPEGAVFALSGSEPRVAYPSR